MFPKRSFPSRQVRVPNRLVAGTVVTATNPFWSGSPTYPSAASGLLLLASPLKEASPAAQPCSTGRPAGWMKKQQHACHPTTPGFLNHREAQPSCPKIGRQNPNRRQQIGGKGDAFPNACGPCSCLERSCQIGTLPTRYVLMPPCKAEIRIRCRYLVGTCPPSRLDWVPGGRYQRP